MPTLYMLIGVPASGKSSWIKNAITVGDAVILSTDNFIESVAHENNTSYDAIFSSTIAEATGRMEEDRVNAVYMDRDIIWDQTNLTRKTRAQKLALIPSHYRKVAVYFLTPSMEEHRMRLDSRTGKTIPANIIRSMISQFTIPAIDEGFDEIICA